MTAAQRTRRDIGYGCFLVVGAASLVFNLTHTMSIGVLIVLWLATASFLAVPLGIVLSIVCWRDGFLPFLSFLTILFIAELMTESGSVGFYNTTTGLYGILVLVIGAGWFLVRRWRVKLHP